MKPFQIKLNGPGGEFIGKQKAMLVNPVVVLER